MESTGFNTTFASNPKFSKHFSNDLVNEFQGQVPAPPKQHMRPLLAEELKRRSNSNNSCYRLSSRTESTTLSSRSTSPSVLCLSRPRSPVDEAVVDDPHRFLIQKMRSASPAPKLRQQFSDETVLHPTTALAISPVDSHRLRLDSPRQMIREKIRSSSPSDFAQLRKMIIPIADHPPDCK